MKLKDALEYQELYHHIKNYNMPIKLAYKINKLNNLIEKEVEFYQDSLSKILNRYAEKDEKGNFKLNPEQTGILIQKEYLDICHKEINELKNLEIENLDFHFNLEELENLNITPAKLNCLTSLIIE